MQSCEIGQQRNVSLIAWSHRADVEAVAFDQLKRRDFIFACFIRSA
jgi:hypothetical protein